VIDRDEGVIGKVAIQKGTFNPGELSAYLTFLVNDYTPFIGCTITINVTQPSQDGSTQECASTSQSRIISSALDLTIHGDGDCGSNNFKKAVSLSFRSNHVRYPPIIHFVVAVCTDSIFYPQIVNPNDACVAFNDQQSQQWRCLEHQKTKQGRDRLLVEGQTTHFTYCLFSSLSKLRLYEVPIKQDVCSVVSVIEH